MALLSRDEKAFKQDIKVSQLWMQRYFDTESKPGPVMLASMQKLSKSRIHVALPDLSASLQAVRNYRLTREKAGQ